MRVGIKVLLRDGVKDSQGSAVLNALGNMGYEGIVDVLVGKYIILEMEEDTEETRDSVKKMCDAILANTVIEKYEIEYLNES